MTPLTTARVRSERIPAPVVCAAFPRSGTQWVAATLEDTYSDLASVHFEPIPVPWSEGIRFPRRVCEIRPPVMTDRRVICIGGDAVALLDAYARAGITPRLVYVRRDPHDCADSCRRVLDLDYSTALARWEEFDRAVREREPGATFEVERLWSGADLPAFVSAVRLPPRDASAWLGRVVDRRTPELAKVAT